MSELIEVILSREDQVRNRSLDSICNGASIEQLLSHAGKLDEFRRHQANLYHRVRALFFLSAIYRYHLPLRLRADQSGLIPFAGYERLLICRSA